MPRVLLSAIVVAFSSALAASVMGCGGGPAFDGQRYAGKGVAFRIGGQPASWTRIEVSDGLLAFRDEQASATILINGRCGRDGEDVPLGALTQHLFLQFTEREIEDEQVVPMDGREAQRTVLRAKLDGVAKGFETVVLKKDGCVYDFVLIAEPSTLARARQPFEQLVASFHTEPH
jgi:hypothetical protein